MSLTLNIPSDQEATLRQVWGPALDRAVLEALAVEGYREGRFGSATVRRLLGHGSRWETEAWLNERGIPLNYTVEDFEADQRTLDLLFSKNA